MSEDEGRLRRISRKVRQDMATKKWSGWSVKAYGPDAGKVARDAYMVALPKEQVERPVSDAPSTGELRGYQREFKGLLSRPEAYHGGWIPEAGKGVQDVSIAHPRSDAEALHTAAMSAIFNRQEGIGVINRKGGYAGTINMPHHLHLSVHQFPQEMQVTQRGNMVDIVPSAQEMAETGAQWVVENAPRLMREESRDPAWDAEKETKKKG